MITGCFGSCCCKTEQIFLILCIVSMKATRSKRGYLVQYLIYICAFLFGWELWEPSSFRFTGDLARRSFGFDSSGFTSPEFHFDFWVWAHPKQSKQNSDKPANFHMVSTQKYKLCPLHKWKTVFKEVCFPYAINRRYFYVKRGRWPKFFWFLQDAGPKHPDDLLRSPVYQGGSSVRRKKSEWGLESSPGVCLEKTWIRHSYLHP